MHATIFESVGIEALSIGDYIQVGSSEPANIARCVIAKHAKSNDRTERIVGWMVEVAGGEMGWWRNGTLVQRRCAA